MASTPSGAADGLLKLLSSSRFDIPEPFELAAALGLKSPRQGMEHGAWANRHQRSPKDGPRFNAGRGLRERASKGFESIFQQRSWRPSAAIETAKSSQSANGSLPTKERSKEYSTLISLVIAAKFCGQ